MQHAFTLHACAGTNVDQKIGGPMLDEPGTNAVFDVVAAAIFDNDRLNALQVQKPSPASGRRGPRR